MGPVGIETDSDVAAMSPPSVAQTSIRPLRLTPLDWSVCGLIVIAGLALCVHLWVNKTSLLAPTESLVLDPATLVLGDVADHAKLALQVTVKNTGEVATRLIGGTTDCSCMTVRDLPLVIEPGTSKTIGIELKTGEAERLMRVIEFHYGNVVMRGMTLTVRAEVVQNPKPGGG